MSATQHDILDLQAAEEEEQQEGWEGDEGWGEGCGEDGLPAVVDEGLSSGDVIARIEELVAGFVNDLAGGKLPEMALVSRSRKNAVQHARGGGAEDEAGGSGAAGSNMVIGLGGKQQTRSLLANQGAGAHAYARVLLVLRAAHEMLVSGRTSSQRDLYYRLHSMPSGLFPTPALVDAAVQDCVALIRVPREALGITAASRGAVAGSLYVCDGPSSPWQDCTACGAGGKAIPGSLAAVNALSFQCSARYLLVIEKDAIFQRLAEDRLWEALPVVMVTARGMPDMATRAFCARLLASFPSLTTLGLADYNPAGVTILRTYKMGSHRKGMEGHKYALPSLRWLGLRSNWLEEVEEAHLQRLTPRDLALLKGLQAELTAGAKGGGKVPGGRGPGSEEEEGSEGGSDGGEGYGGGRGGREGVGGGRRRHEDEGGYGSDVAGEEEEHGGNAAEGEEEDGEEAGSHLLQWLEEMRVMEASGFKADIEACYSVVGIGGLKDLVVRSVLRREYI